MQYEKQMNSRVRVSPPNSKFKAESKYAPKTNVSTKLPRKEPQRNNPRNKKL